MHSFALKTGEHVQVRLYESLIAGEIRDQIILKSSVRKAALRSSQKLIQRLSKLGLARLTAAQRDELRWSLFICYIDTVLAGQHLKLRDDADAQASVLRSAALTRP